MLSAPGSSVAALNGELSAAGEGLVGNDDVLRSVLAGCGDCIKILDLKGRLQFMSEGGRRVMEVDDFGTVMGCPWPDFWHGEGSLEATRAVEVARAGGTAHFMGAANTAKGNPRYWDVRVSPIRGPDGEVSHLLSISRDITAERKGILELKEASERQQLLTEELQHRVKNTLAMVGAIANQTMKGTDIDTARHAFAARLIALSHANDVLIQNSWTGSSIRQVVEGAIAPHRTGTGRFFVHGPDLHLLAKPALALSLAVHELATNAAKYGAMSNSEGTVDISWRISPGEVPGFHFRWAEAGGPIVSKPEKIGFGSKLIDRMLAGDFNGTVRIEYPPTGAVCELAAPLSYSAATM